jgi:transcriptional regulator with XRE-family HTH domain
MCHGPSQPYRVSQCGFHRELMLPWQRLSAGARRSASDNRTSTAAQSRRPPNNLPIWLILAHPVLSFAQTGGVARQNNYGLYYWHHKNLQFVVMPRESRHYCHLSVQCARRYRPCFPGDVEMQGPIMNAPHQVKYSEDSGRQQQHVSDVHVGKRLRLRRNTLGLTQEKLADLLGVTFQQIQKYETGINRIGASRLFALSKKLGVPVQFFFDGVDDAATATAELGQPPGNDNADLINPMATAEVVELMTTFALIADPGQRRALVELARVMAAGAAPHVQAGDSSSVNFGLLRQCATPGEN